MESYYLYSIPQWIIFAGAVAIIYGWIENKKPFSLVGITLFFALGIFALYAIQAGFLAFGEFLSPEEIISQNETGVVDETIELPIEAKLLPVYWGLVVTGIMAVPTLWLEWKDKKAAKALKIILGIVALSLFFMVVGIVKAPA